MKKFIFIYLCFISVVVNGQQLVEEKSAYKNSITLEPLAFLSSGIQLGYEYQLGNYNALKIMGGYYSKTDPIAYEAESFTGFNIQLFYKRYLEANEFGKLRLYFGGAAIYKEIAIDEYEVQERDVNASAFGTGILFGGNSVFENHFYIDFNLGGVLLISDDDDQDVSDAHVPIVNPYQRGIIPRLNFSIGYAF